MPMTWEQVVAVATALPGVEEGTWWRSPGLKVGGKGFARLRVEAEGGLALLCDLVEKEALLASDDPAFYTTPHYDGHPFVLVDLTVVDPGQLAELVDSAWWLRAPARLRRERSAAQ